MRVSNPDRVVFPGSGITKGEVVDYYELVAPRLFPLIEGRALTVERYPKGLAGKGFMQKNAPEHLTDEAIGRHEARKEDGGVTVYPVVEKAGAIAEFANLGVITFHVPPVKVTDPQHPDWLIWDLDPPSGRSDLAREAAHVMRAAIETFGIPTGLMTSGSNGYHLRARVVPDTRSGEAAAVARGISALAVGANPELLTLAFRKTDRGNRVFVDWLRNAPYSTSVAPWSLRAREGAPLACPLDWEELDVVDPGGITMSEVGERLSRADPWLGLKPLELGNSVSAIQKAVEQAGIVLEPFDRFRS